MLGRRERFWRRRWRRWRARWRWWVVGQCPPFRLSACECLPRQRVTGDPPFGESRLSAVEAQHPAAPPRQRSPSAPLKRLDQRQPCGMCGMAHGIGALIGQRLVALRGSPRRECALDLVTTAVFVAARPPARAGRTSRPCSGRCRRAASRRCPPDGSVARSAARWGSRRTRGGRRDRSGRSSDRATSEWLWHIPSAVVRGAIVP